MYVPADHWYAETLHSFLLQLWLSLGFWISVLCCDWFWHKKQLVTVRKTSRFGLKYLFCSPLTCLELFWLNKNIIYLVAKTLKTVWRSPKKYPVVSYQQMSKPCMKYIWIWLDNINVSMVHSLWPGQMWSQKNWLPIFYPGNCPGERIESGNQGFCPPTPPTAPTPRSTCLMKRTFSNF